MSLTEELAQRRDQARTRIPPETLAVMDKAALDLEQSGIARACLTVGDTVPDFALPASDGRIVYLDELLSQGPLVLNFYRGGW